MWAPSVVVDPIAAGLGLPADLFKIILVWIASIPLSYVHGKIRDPAHRHAFNITLGLLQAFFVLDWTCLHPIATIIGSWLIMKFAPRPIQHKLVIGFVSIYLTASHIHRQWTDYMGYTMDFTAAQMMVTLKAAMTAFNLADASAPAESLTWEELEDRVGAVPSFIEYFSYMTHFATFHTGPIISFNHFRSFARRPIEQRNQLEGGIRKALVLRSIVVVVCGVIHGLGSLMPHAVATTDAFRSYGSLPYRMLWLWIAVSLYRFKYYFTWSLIEVACIAAGLGANAVAPKDGADFDNGKFVPQIAPRVAPRMPASPAERAVTAIANPTGAKPHSALREVSALLGPIARPIYHYFYGPAAAAADTGVAHDACRNVDVLGVELPDNMKMVTDSWNMLVGRFFRVYVYGKMKPANGKVPGYLVYATQLTSAFWHGFYPGPHMGSWWYYIFFGVASSLTNVARLSRQIIRPAVLAVSTKYPIAKVVYDWTCAIITACVLNLDGAMFLLLDAGLGFAAWRNVLFFPVWAPIALHFAIGAAAPFFKGITKKYSPKKDA